MAWTIHRIFRKLMRYEISMQPAIYSSSYEQWWWQLCNAYCVVLYMSSASDIPYQRVKPKISSHGLMVGKLRYPCSTCEVCVTVSKILRNCRPSDTIDLWDSDLRLRTKSPHYKFGDGHAKPGLSHALGIGGVHVKRAWKWGTRSHLSVRYSRPLLKWS